MEPISIWRFDPNDVPAQFTVAEIYPDISTHHARIRQAVNNPDSLCAPFGEKLQKPPAATGDDNRDARDAPVSAAGMAWFIQLGLTGWRVKNAASARNEGCIFGVLAS